jgi:hypothetical protein
VEPQNSPLVHEVVVVTKDVGITCDLSNSSTSDSQPTNYICDNVKFLLKMMILVVMNQTSLLKMKF